MTDGRSEARHDQSGRDVRQPRGVHERRAGCERQGEHGDHRVAGAGHVGDFARDGRQRLLHDRRPCRSVEHPHAVLAPRDEDARAGAFVAATRAAARASSAVRIVALRHQLGFVMIRRDERGAAISRRVGNLGIDEQRNAARPGHGRTAAAMTSGVTTPFR